MMFLVVTHIPNQFSTCSVSRSYINALSIIVFHYSDAKNSFAQELPYQGKMMTTRHRDRSFHIKSAPYLAPQFGSETLIKHQNRILKSTYCAILTYESFPPMVPLLLYRVLSQEQTKRHTELMMFHADIRTQVRRHQGKSGNKQFSKCLALNNQA